MTDKNHNSIRLFGIIPNEPKRKKRNQCHGMQPFLTKRLMLKKVIHPKENHYPRLNMWLNIS